MHALLGSLLAQSVERETVNLEATGSIPVQREESDQDKDTECHDACGTLIHAPPEDPGHQSSCQRPIVRMRLWCSWAGELTSSPKGPHVTLRDAQWQPGLAATPDNMSNCVTPVLWGGHGARQNPSPLTISLKCYQTLRGSIGATLGSIGSDQRRTPDG